MNTKTHYIGNFAIRVHSNLRWKGMLVGRVKGAQNDAIFDGIVEVT
jgi:hypothetical protein